MSWSRGGTEGFSNRIKHLSSFHFVGSQEKWAMQREIRFLGSWYTLPHAQNLKPIFEFQTPLAQNSPAGISEFITFGANSDLRRNCILRRNCPAGTSELRPFGANSDLSWEWKSPDIPSQWFLFAFAGAS